MLTKYEHEDNIKLMSLFSISYLQGLVNVALIILELRRGGGGGLSPPAPHQVKMPSLNRVKSLTNICQVLDILWLAFIRKNYIQKQLVLGQFLSRLFLSWDWKEALISTRFTFDSAAFLS